MRISIVHSVELFPLTRRWRRGALTSAGVGLLALGSTLAAPPALAAAPTPFSTLFAWQAPGGTFSSGASEVPLMPHNTVVSPTVLGHHNGDPAAHVFSVSGGGGSSASTGALVDTFLSNVNADPAACINNAVGCPVVTGITDETGATVSTSTPVGALYLGNGTQVFALSPAGHLLSFTTGFDGQASGFGWQVFDLSALSGSGAKLTTGPQPILVGSTVHVYATDNNKHLHDFYKPISDNWSDIDLTNETGVHSIFGEPFAYGGNSIQIVTTSAGGDQLVEIQGVNPDGTLAHLFDPPFVADITALSGGAERPRGTPRPVVTGDNTVNIFVDDTAGDLVDFTKTPTSQWQATPIAYLGEVNLTPAPVWDPVLGLHVLTNDANGTLVDYSTSSSSQPFHVQVLAHAPGLATGDPTMTVVGTGTGPELAVYNNVV